ncbi:glycoside hydrolase family 15 protein, partial [Burkholderia sp. CQ001]
ALHDVPDAGLWEFRGRTEVHTYTSAMCWAACDRLCKIAVRLKRDDRARYWRERADTIHARIMAESWNEELGHFTDTFGGHRLDASLLLLADIGFIDALDARFIATVDAIGRDLKHGNSLYRYVAP